MPRKIVEKVSEDLLRGDLERYRHLAVESGATDAKLITTDIIVIDERVRAKCMYPKCPFYGTNANCPPHGMDLDFARKVVARFKYGILIRLEVPSEDIAGKEAIKKGLWRPSGMKLRKIVSKVESQAFYDGYHLALGLAEGPCKPAFCPEKECRALMPGQSCRHPLKVSASMEGIGMDVYTMATKVGWDIYPIGRSTEPSQVPFGNKLGIVLIC